MLGISIAIACTSPGPVLYRQQRLGRDGKRFMMIKYRSMIVGADARSAWTFRNDPRRTSFGIWLRQVSLNELPQLVNVLRGDMSLAGPRPERPALAEEFEKTIPDYGKRHSMRPGITGWAQGNGLRGDTSVEDRTAYDLQYINNWSPASDAYILLQTLCGGMINRQENPENRKQER